MDTNDKIFIQEKSISNNIAAFLLMFLLGAMAIVLHARLRIPLHLPGRHGIEFMMLLMIGRSLTQFRFSGLYASMGVASMLMIPVLGFKDPFMMVVFILPGIAIDVFYNVFPRLNKKIWMLALASGAAYALIPLSRMIISMFTGYFYTSLLSGLLFPFLTHFAFGFIGGLGGSALIKAFKKNK